MSTPYAVQKSHAVTSVSRLNPANIVTLVRIALVPVFVWVLLAADGIDVRYRWLALGLFVVIVVTDAVDGYLARSRGQVTNFGKLLDPIADKAIIGSALVCLSLLGLVPWWMTMLMVAREVAITIMRADVKRRYGITVPAGKGGKVKMVLQSVAIIVCLAPVVSLSTFGLWLMAAAVVVTVGTGFDYVFRVTWLVCQPAWKR